MGEETNDGDLPMRPPKVFGRVDAATIVNALGSTDLADEGKVHLISIEDVRIALGSRWPARRAQVYETVELQFRKYLAPSDICIAVDDALFLVTMPSVSRMIALGLCFKGLKDVLTHFLGEVRAADVKVHIVTSLAHGVEARRLEMRELEQAELAASVESPLPPSQPQEPAWSGEWPLTTLDGRHLRVSCVMAPVISVKHWALAGYRLSGRILEAANDHPIKPHVRRRLLPRDFVKVDLAVLDRATSRLAAHSPNRAPLLIIQISFAGLSNLSSRAAILAKLQRLLPGGKKYAVLEITDLEAGLPSGQIDAVVSVLRPNCKGVWVQVAPTREALANAHSARVAGVTVRAAELGATNDQIALEMIKFTSLAGRRFRAVSVTGLPDRSLLVDAAKAGFDYLGFRGN